MNFFLKKRKRRKESKVMQQDQVDLDQYKQKPLDKNLQKNLDTIRAELGNSKDLVIREFRLGQSGNIQGIAMYTDGLADQNIVSEFVMKALMIDIREADLDHRMTLDNTLQLIKTQALTLGDVKELKNWKDLYLQVLSGSTVILLDGIQHGLAASTKGWESRGVQEPSNQTVIRGPKEGFSESIRTNTALVRRRIRTPNLWLEQKQIGELTQTEVGIMYIKGLANEGIVKEVHKRLDRIKIDGILESGYIEEFIQDETWTPFPTVYHTERPDVVAAGLLEGRVAIFVDGTPFVLLVPIVFMSFFQAAEDYYQRFDIANFLRVLRYLSFFISLLTPSLYVAITTFHQEIIPTTLVITLAAQREGIPFPAFIEAIMMEITFEILREAGVRMPRAVGNAISIVGALVIGQAAVQAGLVSPAMVIVVAITAIASFVSPAFNMAIAARMIRFGMIILAGMFGLYGIVVALLIMVVHLCNIRSFGMPYLNPVAPFIPMNQRDMMLRFPIWAMKKRPLLISENNRTRVGEEQGPNKPAGDKARNQRGSQDDA